MYQIGRGGILSCAMGSLLGMIDDLKYSSSWTAMRVICAHSHPDHFRYLSGGCRHSVVTMSSIRPGLSEQDLRATKS